MAETTVNLGMLPKNRGEYSSAATYYKDNIVQYNGSSYICTAAMDLEHPSGITGVAPYTSDPTQPNTGWAVFVNNQGGADDGIYDVSANHVTDSQPKVYPSLSAVLNDIPAAKQKGGMEIRFILNNSDYAVDKEEGLTTQPAGTLITSSPTMVDGTYKAAQLLDYFSTLPTNTGDSNALVYYKEVDETYTTWTITLQTFDHKYVQYRLMADSWSVDTEDWAICSDTILVENPEFVYVKTDKDDKILWAIKNDGNIYYGAGVPQQVIDYVQARISALSLDEYEDIVTFLGDLINSDTLTTLLNEKVDKETGKSLIDSNVASNTSYDSTNNVIQTSKPVEVNGGATIDNIQNPEYIQATTDSEDKILEGIKTNGTKVIELPLEIQGVRQETIDNPEFIQVTTDAEETIIEATRPNGKKVFYGGIEGLDEQVKDLVQPYIEEMQSIEESVEGEINSAVNNSKYYPFIHIDVDYVMGDFADELSDVRFVRESDNDVCRFMEDLYAKFDQLCALYPDLVTKYEPMASADTTQTVTINGTDYTINVKAAPDVKARMLTAGFSDYPAYAKGLSAADDANQQLLDTPAYKTYLYKISYQNNKVYGDKCKKRNLFITAATHGWEIAGSFNSYLLANGLCTKSGTLPFYAKLLSGFDVWIQPCLNGYSIYHSYIIGYTTLSGYQSRYNYNVVDINRNYPTKEWVRNDSIHTGVVAGNQFENQLTMAWMAKISPDIIIDHHNFNVGHRFFYTVGWDDIMRNPALNALSDLSFCCLKNLSTELGTEDFRLFFNPTSVTTDLPQQLGEGYGNTGLYGCENYSPISMTLEVLDRWLFRDGYWHDNGTAHTNNVYKVNEYSLRVQLTHYINTLCEKLQSKYNN